MRLSPSQAQIPWPDAIGETRRDSERLPGRRPGQCITTDGTYSHGDASDSDPSHHDRYVRDKIPLGHWQAPGIAAAAEARCSSRTEAPGRAGWLSDSAAGPGGLRVGLGQAVQ